MLNSNEKAVRKAIATMFPDRYNRQNWRTLLSDFVNDSLKPVIISWFNNWKDKSNSAEEKPAHPFPPELTPAAELLAKQEGHSYARLAIFYYMQLNQIGALGANYMRLAELHKTSHSHNSFEDLEKPVDLSSDGLSLAILKYFTGTDRLDQSNFDALAEQTGKEYDQYRQLMANHILGKQSQLGKQYEPAKDDSLPLPPVRLFSAVTLLAAFRGISYQSLAWEVYTAEAEKEEADNALDSAYSNNERLIQQVRASNKIIDNISDPDSRLN
jgi:hypothetical protein